MLHMSPLWATVPLNLGKRSCLRLRYAPLRHRLPEPVITFGICAQTSGRDSCSMISNALLKNCSRNTPCPCCMAPADFHTFSVHVDKLTEKISIPKKKCRHLRCSRNAVYSACLPSMPIFLPFFFIDGKRRNPTKWASLVAHLCCLQLFEPQKNRYFNINFKVCFPIVYHYVVHLFQTQTNKNFLLDMKKIKSFDIAGICKRSFTKMSLNCIHDPMRVLSCAAPPTVAAMLKFLAGAPAVCLGTPNVPDSSMFLLIRFCVVRAFGRASTYTF